MKKPIENLNHLKSLLYALEKESMIIPEHNDPQAYKEAWEFAYKIIEEHQNYIFKLENRLNIFYKETDFDVSNYDNNNVLF